MTWNSYARFTGDVIDFNNRTAFDVLELSKIANQITGTVEALRVRAIEFAKDLHASEVRRARELATLSFEVRIRFTIAEQRSTLSNTLYIYRKHNNKPGKDMFSGIQQQDNVLLIGVNIILA